MPETKQLTPRPIRDFGKDEYWLQDRICENPAILGMGELEVVSKEKKQKGGGRLDILLRNEDEDFFEVEVMLGATDESHIVRTIEYWDLEKRRWPKRQHTAVLVAKSITTRFYNIIHILSLNVPIVGIQAQAYDLGDSIGLTFNKIIDSYQEPESDPDPIGYYTRDSLLKTFPETLKVVDRVRGDIVGECPQAEVVYKKYGAAFYVDGDRKINIHKRGSGQSSVEYVISPANAEGARSLLDVARIKFDSKYHRIRVWTDEKALGEHIQVHKELFKLT